MAETGALDLPSLRAQLATALGTDLKFISDQTLTTNATCAARSVRWHFDSPAGRPLVAEWSESSVNFFQPTLFRRATVLDGAIITGKLDANRAEFQALQCQSLKVGDDLVMFEAHCGQEANFIHAQIVHDFYVPNSSFQSRFNATGMSVGGSLIIDGSRFGDQANFDVAAVGNDFKGQRVCFENPDALTEFRSLKVEGLMDFTRAQFAGPANFILAHIKGNFQAQDATFEDARSFQELKRLTGDTFTFNTDFGSMRVDGFAIFENVRFARSVSFRNARFGNLYFDGVRWPDARGLMTYTNDPKTNDLLRLEGMEFETIRDVTSSHFLHTKAQLVESQTNLLEMFASRSPYSFDIYAQLENYFRREGTPALADEIFIKAKERERVEARGLPRLANWFLGWTVGYGRQPWRAFGWSLGVIGVWGFLCQGCMVRKNPPGKNRPPSLGFALFYSLGTFLPIIDLGTEKELESRHDQQWFNYLIALEKILGYILVPLWTMALTGLIK